MDQIQTHSSSKQDIKSSWRTAKRHMYQSSLGQQNWSLVNSRPPENYGPPPYSVFPAWPQPGRHGQQLEAYPVYRQSPVTAGSPVFTYPVDAMNGAINQPYHIVSGSDVLFGPHPSVSQPRQLVYPYYSVPNSIQRDNYLYDPRRTQDQVPLGLPPSQYVHPTQSPINPQIFYSTYDSSVSLTQTTPRTTPDP
jgi:hypothetical protein